MSTSIDTLIANARAYADAAVSEGKATIEKIAQLSDLINSLRFVESLPLASYSQIIEKAQTLASYVIYSQPQKPPGLGNFGNIPQLPDIDKIDIKDLQNLVAEIIREIERVPDVLAQAVALFSIVQNNLLNELTNAGNSAAEAALWQRSRDRIMDAAEVELDQLEEEFAKYGSYLPQGAYFTARERIIAKANYALVDADRDVLVKYADNYQSARQHAFAQLVNLIQAGFGIAGEKARMIASAAEAAVQTARAQIDNYRLMLDAYGYAFDKILREQAILAEIYRGDVSSYAAKMDAYGRAFAVLQAASADQLMADKTYLSSFIENSRAKLDAMRVEVEVRIGEMREIGNILANKVAGALTSLNTLAAQIEELIEEK